MYIYICVDMFLDIRTPRNTALIHVFALQVTYAASCQVWSEGEEAVTYAAMLGTFLRSCQPGHWDRIDALRLMYLKGSSGPVTTFTWACNTALWFRYRRLLDGLDTVDCPKYKWGL